MKTSELVEFLTDQDFTDVQAYNMLTNDLFDDPAQLKAQTIESQRIIRFFEYQITSVLLPVIRASKAKAHEIFKASEERRVRIRDLREELDFSEGWVTSGWGIGPDGRWIELGSVPGAGVCVGVVDPPELTIHGVADKLNSLEARCVNAS